MQFYRDESATRSNKQDDAAKASAETAPVPVFIPEAPIFERLGILRLLFGVFFRVVRNMNALLGLLSWFKDIGHNSMRLRLRQFDLELTQDPHRAHHVLVTDWLKHPKTKWEHSVLEPVMGGGLILLQGEKWHAHRMLMAELFSPTVIQELAQTVRRFTYARMEFWRENEVMDLTQEVRCIMNPCMFHTLFEAHSQSIDEFSHRLVDVEKALETRVFNPVHRMNPSFPKASQEKRTMEDLARLVRPTQEIPSKCPYHRMLKLFRGKNLTNKEMVQEGVTLVGAGATTVHLLSWSGYLLGANPEAQEKLYAEVTKFFEEHPMDQDIPILEMEKLPYLTAVIHESLRLYPPAPFLLRHREKKGSFVFIPIWTMHRNHQYWDDSHDFKPERWIGEDGKIVNHPSFLPFGAGPRVCIGKRFAMTEARVFLAELVYRYRVRYAGKKPPKAVTTVLTRPKKPIKVVLERRQFMN